MSAAGLFLALVADVNFVALVVLATFVSSNRLLVGLNAVLVFTLLVPGSIAAFILLTSLATFLAVSSLGLSAAMAYALFSVSIFTVFLLTGNLSTLLLLSLVLTVLAVFSSYLQLTMTSIDLSKIMVTLVFHKFLLLFLVISNLTKLPLAFIGFSVLVIVSIFAVVTDFRVMVLLVSTVTVAFTFNSIDFTDFAFAGFLGYAGLLLVVLSELSLGLVPTVFAILLVSGFPLISLNLLKLFITAFSDLLEPLAVFASYVMVAAMLGMVVRPTNPGIGSG